MDAASATAVRRHRRLHGPDPGSRRRASHGPGKAALDDVIYPGTNRVLGWPSFSFCRVTRPPRVAAGGATFAIDGAVRGTCGWISASSRWGWDGDAPGSTLLPGIGAVGGGAATIAVGGALVAKGHALAGAALDVAGVLSIWAAFNTRSGEGFSSEGGLGGPPSGRVRAVRAVAAGCRCGESRSYLFGWLLTLAWLGALSVHETPTTPTALRLLGIV